MYVEKISSLGIYNLEINILFRLDCNGSKLLWSVPSHIICWMSSVADSISGTRQCKLGYCPPPKRPFVHAIPLNKTGRLALMDSRKLHKEHSKEVDHHLLAQVSRKWFNATLSMASWKEVAADLEWKVPQFCCPLAIHRWLKLSRWLHDGGWQLYFFVEKNYIFLGGGNQTDKYWRNFAAGLQWWDH